MLSDLPTSYLSRQLRATPAWLPLTINSDTWQFAPHLQLLNEKLALLAWGHIKRLLITMPPRHGKSVATSQYLPAWYVGTFPDRRVILTSYSAEYAAEWGRKVRDILEEYGEALFGIKIRWNSKAADHWDIEGHLGGMVTAGAGGSLTGRGANLLVIDDPVKNYKEAASATYRQNMWEWYRSTVYTRLQPQNSAIVLMMTRWSDDDLAGRILTEMKSGGPQWDHLNLPAYAEENDPLGRAVGEPLWPTMFGKPQLAEIERTLGSYWWSALYQQRPQPRGGGIFKREWFKYYTTIGGEQPGDVYFGFNGKMVRMNKCTIFTTMDLAASTKETADYTVLSTWAMTPDKDLLLLDVVRDHFETTRHQALIHQVFERWNPSFIGIEQVGYQLALIQQTIRDGLPIRALHDQRDKVSRALFASARYEGGTVYHPSHAPWLADYEDELLLFPRGAHDDMVDTAGYACIVLMRDLGEIPVATTRITMDPLQRAIEDAMTARPTDRDEDRDKDLEIERTARTARFLNDLQGRI